MALVQHLFPLAPDPRERIWGGTRLGDAGGARIGESWIAFEGSRVARGPAQGRTIRDLMADDPVALVGPETAERYDGRFPLLVKLLDTADWLSVQVHPDDEQARRMVGPNEFGKTEAWYFLDVAGDGRILAGVKPGVSREQVRQAVRDGTVLEVAAEIRVQAGDAMPVPAGMLHALGPGLLIYEVQQASDTTYRAYDWGRPTSADRRLHIEECAAVIQPHVATPTAVARAGSGSGSRGRPVVCRAVESEYFEVDSIWIANGTMRCSTLPASFQLLTVARGSVEIAAGSETVRLGPLETILVAAATGDYEIRVESDAQVMRTNLPASAKSEA